MFRVIQIIIVFIFLLHFQSFGQEAAEQVSDSELSSFVKQAQSSGMSESQLAAAAAAKGFSQADLANFRERIEKLKSKNNPNKADNKENNTERSIDSTDIDKTDIRNLKDEYELKKRLLAEEKRNKIFGLNIFNNKEITFEPNLKIATPKNYVLGIGDELSIDITGFAYAHYNSKVSAEGNIKIENLNPIYVNGQTIDQAKEKIIQKLRSIYGGIGNGLMADITLSKIRSIKVNVIGEAVNPGTYTVSSLATVFNLLYSAGGPTDIGSLRSIELVRNGKLIRVLDLYDFLLNGDLKDNMILHDQDVIRIPYVDTRVSIAGLVRNPKIFEMKKGETLKSLLNFCGGFSEKAYQKNIRLYRETETGLKLLTLESNLWANFIPKKSDQYFVDSLSNKFTNIVYIEGAVLREGTYEIEGAPTLKKLIARADGLTKDAFKDRIFLKRVRKNMDPEVFQIDLSKIIDGTEPDIALNALDSVYIRKYSDLRGKRTISVSGEVNQPLTFDFSENLTVGDAIIFAGGFKFGASPAKIEIARRIINDSTYNNDSQTVDIIQFTINKNYKLTNEESQIKLEPFDKIYVRKLASYEEQKAATITGEVVYPGPYSIFDKTERISDLITKSGGLRKESDISSAKFTRNGNQVGIDLNKIMADKSDINNLLLHPGDALHIPRKTETVSIFGNVYNQSTVPYQHNLKLSDYISLAGGSTDSAFVRKVYVKYSNGRMKQTQSFLGIKLYPKITAGTEIYVPVHHKQRWTPAERIAVSSAIVSITTILVTVLRAFGSI